jgi:hypothetical protein
VRCAPRWCAHQDNRRQDRHVRNSAPTAFEGSLRTADPPLAMCASRRRSEQERAEGTEVRGGKPWFPSLVLTGFLLDASRPKENRRLRRRHRLKPCAVAVGQQRKQADWRRRSHSAVTQPRKVDASLRVCRTPCGIHVAWLKARALSIAQCCSMSWARLVSQ